MYKSDHVSFRHELNTDKEKVDELVKYIEGKMGDLGINSIVIERHLDWKPSRIEASTYRDPETTIDSA
jgi:hypothetical protein